MIHSFPLAEVKKQSVAKNKCNLHILRQVTDTLQVYYNLFASTS